MTVNSTIEQHHNEVKKMTETRLVTLQKTWEIQVCDNELNAFSCVKTFHSEDDAKDYFDNYKVRLVQKALVGVEEK